MRYTFDMMRGSVRVCTSTQKEQAIRWLNEQQLYNATVNISDSISNTKQVATLSEIDGIADLCDDFMLVYRQGAAETLSCRRACEWLKYNPIEADYFGLQTKFSSVIKSVEQLQEWREARIRNSHHSFSGDIMPAKDAINPSHYQALLAIPAGDTMVELQWLEHLQYHAHFRDPAVFKGAVEMQARKYMDRCGGKDAELQEMKKAIWYMKFLAAYVANGNKPIYVKDIESLLGD